MTALRFADPQFLTLLVVLPLLGYWHFRRRRLRAALRYSTVDLVKRSTPRRRQWVRHALFAIRATGLLALIVAFARPQTGITEESVTTSGIDIVLALDL